MRSWQRRDTDRGSACAAWPGGDPDIHEPTVCYIPGHGHSEKNHPAEARLPSLARDNPTEPEWFKQELDHAYF